MRGAMAMGILIAGLIGPAQAQTGPTLSETDMRELLDATKETAKATREGVGYARVTPDILTQILAKLDKIEDKLDKVENAIRRDNGSRRSGR
jgi:hypothetical protein